jgi:hypothetical protein
MGEGEHCSEEKGLEWCSGSEGSEEKGSATVRENTAVRRKGLNGAVTVRENTAVLQ